MNEEMYEQMNKRISHQFYGHFNKTWIAHVFFTFEKHIWRCEVLQMEIPFERANRNRKENEIRYRPDSIWAEFEIE